LNDAITIRIAATVVDQLRRRVFWSMSTTACHVSFDGPLGPLRPESSFPFGIGIARLGPGVVPRFSIAVAA